MDPLYFLLHASRERAVTIVGVLRRCGYARTAARALMVFACLAVLIPAFPAEAAVHQKFETARRAPAAAESPRPLWTAPAVHDTRDTPLEDGDDDDDDADIRIHSEWTSPALLHIALPTLIASPGILTGDCCLRGPPATTPFTS